MAEPMYDEAVPICAIDTDICDELLKQGFERNLVDALVRVLELSRAALPAGGKFPKQVLLTRDKLEELLNSQVEPSERLSALVKATESQLALAHTIPPRQDFTFFVDRSGCAEAAPDEPPRERDLVVRLVGGESGTDFDGELWMWDVAGKKIAAGRAIICSCSKGKRWSITFRRQQEYPPPSTRASEFLNDLDQVVDCLHEVIFPNDSRDEHGLLVVAGRTGSGKSEIARGLIQRYVNAAGAAPSKRRQPHVVAYEDPIEQIFGPGITTAFDCTQRERGRDARDLSKVLKSALRQTPTVLYVGETRDRRDWKRLLEFAGTGHLVITTAHAGSLVEAVGNILKETDSDTPATRSIVADRLLAVVHVKNDNVAGTSFLVPAIWHRTPLGIKALMAEGLSSLLPNTARALATVPRPRLPGSLGRYWFARELVKRATLIPSPAVADGVMRKALEWDLEGI